MSIHFLRKDRRTKRLIPFHRIGDCVRHGLARVREAPAAAEEVGEVQECAVLSRPELDARDYATATEHVVSLILRGCGFRLRPRVEAALAHLNRAKPVMDNSPPNRTCAERFRRHPRRPRRLTWRAGSLSTI